MRRTILLVLVLFPVNLVSSAMAAENKLESWYTYWGIGWAGHSYTDDTFEQLQDQQGLDHVELGLDLLGFYWPVGENTIIGGILNGTVDVYSVGSLSTAVTSSLLSFTTMRFLNGRIGQGPFIRGDIGLARASVRTEIGDVSATETSDAGLGFLLGGGYGLPVSAGTRLLLNLNYSVRRIEGESFKIFQISLGGLF